MNAVSWLEGFPASEKWRTLLARRGPLAVTCLLALGIAMQAGFMVTDLTGGITGWTGASPSPPLIAARAARHVGTNVALITNAHLFGVQRVAAATPEDDATAPQSTSPLLLTGVLARADPVTGLAIIGQSGQATRVYRVGEPVPGGATLHSVYADRAVIDRAGHLETLSLPQQSTRGVSAFMPPPAAAGVPETPVAARVQRLVSDPGFIGDIMRPVLVRGQGVRVFPGRNHQAFSRLGLRPGDVVTAINGTALDADSSQGAEILRTLESTPEARVTVMRNGQPQDLTLNVAQVVQEAEALAGPGAQGAPAPGAPGAPTPTPAPPLPGGATTQ
jgi:general secretion pathway protein C